MSGNRGRWELTKTETVGDITYASFQVWIPLFERKVEVDVCLDQPLSLGLSLRQTALLEQSSTLDDGLSKIEEALYSHWWNNSDYWVVDLEISSPREAMSHASLLRVAIDRETSPWGPDTYMLRFKVDWDPEHGAGVFVRNGVPAEFGDL